MPNNTTVFISEAGSLFLSGPYLLWLEKDVLPYIFGTASLITILLGIIFNIALCKLFAKEKHIGIKRTIIQLVAVDVLAEVFVLAPGMYASYSKSEDLPYTYCILNGLFNLAIFLIQFGILSLGVAMSFFMENPTKCKHICSIVCICTVSMILAVIPVTWKDGYVYMTSEYQCAPNRSIKKAYINVIIFTGVFTSFILTCTISAVLIKKFLSRNTKVSELRLSQSGETVTMEDQTGKHHRTAEQLSNKRRNRFRSDETVSIEDHTRSYDITTENVSDHGNRFRSDVTVSMEDQTQSYRNVPTQSGITVSMEDRTHSYSKNFKHFESDITTSELTAFGRSTDLTINCLRETNTSETFFPTTIDILNKDVSIKLNTPNGFVSGEVSDIGPCENNQGYKCMVTNRQSSKGSDDEISFDGTYGPGIVSREASMSNRSNRSSVRSTDVPYVKTNGNVQTGNANILANILQSEVADQKKTFKLASINVIVSFAVLACWSPFVILVYIEMYSTLWWEGWSTMAVLCANISYCIKPFIILGIRGQLVHASKAVLPKSVENRMNRIALFLTETASKVGKRIY